MKYGMHKCQCQYCHEYDQDYPEKLIFKTDSDGVDHLICHYYAGIFGEESYLGDYVVGLHRFCPYFQEEGAEVTQKNYSEEKVAEKEKEMETEMTEMEEDRIWKSDKRLNKKLWKNKYLRYRRSK